MAIFSSLITCLSLLTLASFTLGEDSDDSSVTPANIILIMVDDLGRSDIGAFGAEWETPNIDSFIEDSVTLSHHYIGYVCSASRSQFLTGRYSYHQGYGELDVFDLGKTAGFIPRGSPTIAEYLKHFSNYKTYAIGKWQLGSASDSQIAVSRGFDSFWGYNGGMEEYNSKLREMDEYTYFDFYENDKPISYPSGEYSTDQYYSKAVSIMEKHYNNEDTQNKPFFMYLALQAIHGPFTETLISNYETEYEKYCEKYHSESFTNWQTRQDVCGAMIGIDTQFGTFLDSFTDNDILNNNNVWDNTIIVLTSDNGGSLDKGSCNYPLRGGKNTFHEGGQRVLAIVGGGYIPQEQRGTVLDGLVSNVDWAPTFLSFANLIPADYTHVTLGDSDAELPMVLDGYNLYSYIMGENDLWLRDHLVFHMKPNLKFTLDWELDDISDYSVDDMEEFALIFYDTSGNLWKYLNVDISSNIIGDPITNAGFCEKSDDTTYYHTDTTEDDVVYKGVFNLNVDKREKHNMETLGATGNSKHLSKIMKEKLNYYINSNSLMDGTGSLSSKYLYGHFACLLRKTDEINDACNDAAFENNAWVTFMTDDEIAQSIKDVCDVLDEEHTIYKLMTTPFKFPEVLDEESTNGGKNKFLEYISDNTENIKKLNYLTPKTKTTKRKYTKGMTLDLEKVWPEGDLPVPIADLSDISDMSDIDIDDVVEEAEAEQGLVEDDEHEEEAQEEAPVAEEHDDEEEEEADSDEEMFVSEIRIGHFATVSLKSVVIFGIALAVVVMFCAANHLLKQQKEKLDSGYMQLP